MILWQLILMFTKRSYYQKLPVGRNRLRARMKMFNLKNINRSFTAIKLGFHGWCPAHEKEYMVWDNCTEDKRSFHETAANIFTLRGSQDRQASLSKWQMSKPKLSSIQYKSSNRIPNSNTHSVPPQYTEDLWYLKLMPNLRYTFKEPQAFYPWRKQKVNEKYRSSFS